MPDNLKAAVIKHTRSEIIIQKDFNEFAEHYNFIVYPARSREPQDKALAERCSNHSNSDSR
jgi:transposase